MKQAATVLRFGLVGGAAFVLDSGLLMLLAQTGLGYYGGRVFSLAASLVFSFFLNRSFTFRTVNPPAWQEFGSYLRVVLLGSAINYALYAGGVQAGLHPLFALGLATIVTAVFNYIYFAKIFVDQGPTRTKVRRR